MTHKRWKHYCTSQNREKISNKEICPDCGSHGAYYGTGYSVVEFMGMYASGTNLSPQGPHRNFADALLFPSFRKCPKCQDRRIVPDEKGDFVDCDLCSSKRLYTFNGTEEEHQAIRKQVLTAFPGNESPRNSASVPATTEPAPQPPPPAGEPEPKEPSLPEASPKGFFARPSKDQSVSNFAESLAKAIRNAFDESKNPTVSDHRSRYTYFLKWWDKRGGTFYVKMDGIEIRAISRPDVTLAVLFIESPFVASVIVDWELKELGVKKSALEKYRKYIPRPAHFEIIRGAAFLPIDEGFTKEMFDQLMDAMEEIGKSLTA